MGGVWFARSAWVKLLFRERFITVDTAEDYHWSNALAKYAGIRSYIMPFDGQDHTFNGVSADYMAISAKGDTSGVFVCLLSTVALGDVAGVFKKNTPSLSLWAGANQAGVLRRTLQNCFCAAATRGSAC